MTQIRVQQGESLWTIARRQLPQGASDAQIQQAAAQLAQTNGLAPDARLKLHQLLTVPDHFAGVVNDPQAAEAVSQLRQKAGPARHAQAQARARPLLDFSVGWPLAPREPGEPIALPDIAGQPVVGSVSIFKGVHSVLGDAITRTVSGNLGKLTPEAFDAVHAELGGRSLVKYDPGRSYEVADFMPPVLQALLHRDLEVPGPTTLKGSKKVIEALGEEPGLIAEDLKVGLTMNCHATAYESVRAYQGQAAEVAIFYGEMITMDGLVADETRFRKLGVAPSDNPGALGALQPGDVVQMYEESDWGRMTMLLHSAVYVGGGLFFEKPNTEGPGEDNPEKYQSQEETPFRLVTLQELVKPIGGQVEKYRLEAYRAVAPLPDPMEVFGSSLGPKIEAWAQQKGRKLGAELVTEFEQGLGGGIRAEGVSGLIRAPIQTQPDGTSTLT